MPASHADPVRECPENMWDFREVTDEAELPVATVYEYACESKRLLLDVQSWQKKKIPTVTWDLKSGEPTLDAKNLGTVQEALDELRQRARILFRYPEVYMAVRAAQPTNLKNSRFSTFAIYVSDYPKPWLSHELRKRRLWTLLLKKHPSRSFLETGRFSSIEDWASFSSGNIWRMSLKGNARYEFGVRHHIFRIDWKSADNELKQEFSKWIKSCRGDMKPIKKQGQRKHVEEPLKWLSAWRLSRRFSYGESQALLTERRTEGGDRLGILPIYTRQSTWCGVISEAKKYLTSLSFG